MAEQPQLEAEEAGLVLPALLRRHAPGQWSAARALLQQRFDLEVEEDESLFLVMYKTDSALWRDGSAEQLLVLRQSRGAIYEKATYACVCLPFLKFWGSRERLAAVVPEPWCDQGVRVLEKCDGSMTKLFHHGGRWRLASNSKLNVDVPRASMKGRTCRQLFEEAAEASGAPFQQLTTRLDPRCCYMFERMHPDHIIVVPYTSPRLVHIGTRNMTSLHEKFVDIGVPQPRQCVFANLKECALAAEEISWRVGEGFVVTDMRGVGGGEGLGGGRQRHSCLRVKVKSLSYLRVHHGTTDATASDPVGFCLDTWLRAEGGEITAYFPQFADTYACVEEQLGSVFAALRMRFDGAVQDCEGARSDVFKWLRGEEKKEAERAGKAAKAAKGEGEAGEVFGGKDYWSLLRALAGGPVQAQLSQSDSGGSGSGSGSGSGGSGSGSSGSGGSGEGGGGRLLCIKENQVIVELVRKRGGNNRSPFRGLLKRMLLARLPDDVKRRRIAGKRSEPRLPGEKSGPQKMQHQRQPKRQRSSVLMERLLLALEAAGSYSPSRELSKS